MKEVLKEVTSKTIEELEESRQLYLSMFEAAKREKLEWYKKFFEDKIIESEEHIRMTEKLEEGIITKAGEYIKLPKETAEKQKVTKTKMLAFWKGLLEEVRRRLKGVS